MKKWVGYTFLLIALLMACTSSPEFKVTKTKMETLPTDMIETVQAPMITVAPPGDMLQIPLIAIGDNGVSGMKIGCDDSLVMVDRPFIGPDALVQAYSDLLGIREREYGQSGLYDPLYQSTLTVKEIYVREGVAYVYLLGTFMMGGECDIPRVQAKLEQTALQFPEVSLVQVFVNDKTLAEAISLK